MAEYFDLDAMQLRAVFVVLNAPAGAGLLLYLLMWITVSNAPEASPPTAS